jgi:phosphate transport system substrate-binding protein
MATLPCTARRTRRSQRETNRRELSLNAARYTCWHDQSGEAVGLRLERPLWLARRLKCCWWVLRIQRLEGADVGLLGREIWPIEVQAFESVEGHAPLVLKVATVSFDVPKATFALMIFVPKSNPIASLSTRQLEHIFGNLETPPEGKPMWTWGDVGLKGAWATRPVHLYGFNVDNDKSLMCSPLIFKKDERSNCGLREFSNGLGPSGADAGDLIVQADGDCISNVHYATPAVKALAISTRNNGAPIAPTRESVAANSIR